MSAGPEPGLCSTVSHPAASAHASSVAAVWREWTTPRTPVGVAGAPWFARETWRAHPTAGSSPIAVLYWGQSTAHRSTAVSLLVEPSLMVAFHPGKDRNVGATILRRVLASR